MFDCRAASGALASRAARARLARSHQRPYFVSRRCRSVVRGLPRVLVLGVALRAGASALFTWFCVDRPHGPDPTWIIIGPASCLARLVHRRRSVEGDDDQTRTRPSTTTSTRNARSVRRSARFGWHARACAGLSSRARLRYGCWRRRGELQLARLDLGGRLRLQVALARVVAPRLRRARFAGLARHVRALARRRSAAPGPSRDR